MILTCQIFFGIYLWPSHPFTIRMTFYSRDLNFECNQSASLRQYVPPLSLKIYINTSFDWLWRFSDELTDWNRWKRKCQTKSIIQLCFFSCKEQCTPLIRRFRKGAKNYSQIKLRYVQSNFCMQGNMIIFQ